MLVKSQHLGNGATWSGAHRCYSGLAKRTSHIQGHLLPVTRFSKFPRLLRPLRRCGGKQTPGAPKGAASRHRLVRRVVLSACTSSPVRTRGNVGVCLVSQLSARCFYVAFKIWLSRSTAKPDALDDDKTRLRLAASQTATMRREMVSGNMGALGIAPTLHFVELSGSK